MLLTTFFILLFHPSFFVAILSIIHVILIILWKLSPCFEVVPEFVELMHLVHWCVFVADIWNWFYLRKPWIVLETRAKFLIKICFVNIIFIWNSVVKWQAWIVFLTLSWITKRLIRLLDFEPNLFVFFSDFVSKFIRMEMQSGLFISFPISYSLASNFLSAKPSVP